LDISICVLSSVKNSVALFLPFSCNGTAVLVQASFIGGVQYCAPLI